MPIVNVASVQRIPNLLGGSSCDVLPTGDYLPNPGDPIIKQLFVLPRTKFALVKPGTVLLYQVRAL